MKEGLPEIALRYAGRKVGQGLIAVGATEVAGFFGKALYYAGTEPTNGSQTMLAHIGVGMATYNPLGEGKQDGLALAKDNALGGLVVGGIILAAYIGGKVWRSFSATQNGGWKGAQEAYQIARQKRAKKKARTAKELSRVVEDLQED